jgi:hypothetical protein
MDEIIERFRTHVKGQVIDVSKYTGTHDGKEGHWLEERMGLKPNARNEPDIFGYEMKKGAAMITFGDWCATDYLFSKKRKSNVLPSFTLSRKEFLESFGQPNPTKNNRLAWSGRCFPKVGDYNEFGQKLVVDAQAGTVTAMYSSAHDKRPNKPNFELKEFPIAFWTREKLEKHVSSKFGQKGFFMCKKVGDTYQKIRFGPPITFEFFIQKMVTGNIFIDGGMYDGNSRKYSQFRASEKFWDTLISEEFE